jgi:hypothetical protein
MGRVVLEIITVSSVTLQVKRRCRGLGGDQAARRGGIRLQRHGQAPRLPLAGDPAALERIAGYAALTLGTELDATARRAIGRESRR